MSVQRYFISLLLAIRQNWLLTFSFLSPLGYAAYSSEVSLKKDRHYISFTDAENSTFTSPMSVRRKRFNTALPKLPVPPVIRRVLPVNTPINVYINFILLLF